MQNEIEITLSPEEKLQKAQGQFNALVLGMLAYLKAHELAVDECLAFLGDRLALGWDPNLTAIDFLREAAAFLSSVGCNLRSLSSDADQAEAVFSSWPPNADWTTEGFLSFWGLSQKEADVIWDMNMPVANRLGLDYQWQRQGSEVTLMLTRQA